MKLPLSAIRNTMPTLSPSLKAMAIKKAMADETLTMMYFKFLSPREEALDLPATLLVRAGQAEIRPCSNSFSHPTSLPRHRSSAGKQACLPTYSLALAGRLQHSNSNTPTLQHIRR